MRFLEKIMPENSSITKKHRFCENCSHYLGDYNAQPPVIECENCNSNKINGVFVEYDLKSCIRDAFEVRNLSFLINAHSRLAPPDNNFVTDITTSTNFRKLKQEFLPGDNDVFKFGIQMDSL